jgi:hypothetical protein
MEAELIRADFLQWTKDHKIEVRHNDGVYRDLFFQKPGTVIDSFGIITWPGHLTIYGDRGTYTFARIYDMHNFFRRSRGSLTINPGYWGQKLEGICRRCGYEEISEDFFRDAVMGYLESWGIEEESDEWSDMENQLIEALEYVDLSGDCRSAYDELEGMEFTSNAGNEYRIDDLWDHSFTDYTYNYIWCLYAIVWGIEQFDKWKVQEEIRRAIRQHGAYKYPTFGRLMGVPAPKPSMVSAPKREKLSADELMDDLLSLEVERQRRWWKQHRKPVTYSIPFQKITPPMMKRLAYPQKVYGPQGRKNDDKKTD